jgi:hypothetical protein
LGARQIRIERDCLLCGGKGRVEVAKRRIELGEPGEGQRIARIEVDGFLDARPGARQVEAGLLRKDSAITRWPTSGWPRHSSRRPPMPVLVVLDDGGDRLQAQRVRCVVPASCSAPSMSACASSR